jgi:REP element-mobilizing transposase RayT
MTAPRRVLPGVTYLVTRRCAQRQFLLRPSPVTTAILRYVLAVAAHRFGVSVHAYCVLSNHLHMVVTDPDARLPAFAQYVGSLVARAVNASLGRWESFWAPASYSAVALASPEDVVEKTAYVLANPVAAGLVRTAREWPGLWSAPEQIGASPAVVDRPETFFRPHGYMPAKIDFALATPPGFDSREAFQDRLREALVVLEERARRGLAAERKPILGVAGVLAQSCWARARGGERRRELNPRVACRDKWKRVEALGRLAEFLESYREALATLRAGVRDVLFPPGTYGLRVVHGVRCAVA